MKRRSAFHGHYFGRSLFEKGAREPTRSRPDLDDGDAVEGAGRARDFSRQVQIEKVILTEGFAGLKPVGTHDLAQRRQRRVERRSEVSGLAARCVFASWPARSSAAMKLSGRANPLPAMSKAVPWSGEVRTKGRPSVTFTASSKATS